MYTMERRQAQSRRDHWHLWNECLCVAEPYFLWRVHEDPFHQGPLPSRPKDVNRRSPIEAQASLIELELELQAPELSSSQGSDKDTCNLALAAYARQISAHRV